MTVLVSIGDDSISEYWHVKGRGGESERGESRERERRPLDEIERVGIEMSSLLYGPAAVITNTAVITDIRIYSCHHCYG